MTIETTHKMDYLSVSVQKWQPVDDVYGKAEYITPPIGNYNIAKKYHDGTIAQWHTHKPELKTNVVMSGATLDKIRNIGISDSDIIRHVKTLNRVNFKRIDLAVTVDVTGMEKPFTPEYAWKLYQDGKCETRLTADKPIVDIDKRVETLYIGSRKTRNRILRIYDKGIDLGQAANELIRIELETRRAANGIADEVLQGRNYAGIIRRVVDFNDEVWEGIMESPPLPRLRNDENSRDGNMENRLTWLLESVAPAMARIASEQSGGFENEFWDGFASRVAYHYNKLVDSSER